MCVFSLGKKSHSGYREPKFEISSLVRNKDLVYSHTTLNAPDLIRNKDLLLSGHGDGGGYAGKAGCLGLLLPRCHLRASLCSARTSGEADVGLLTGGSP